MKKLYYIANMRMPTERAHGVQVITMCSAYAANGFDLTLLVPNRKTHIKEDVFEFYKLNKNFMIRREWSLDLFPYRFCPQVVSYWLNAITFTISLLFKVGDMRKCVVYSRDPVSSFVLSWFVPKLCYEVHDAPAKTLMNQWFFSKLKRIVVTNSFKRDLLIKTFGVNSDRVHVAHHGVDLNKFDSKMSGESARDELGFPHEYRYVLYTGHLYDWKGVYTLARATRFLPENVRVVFVGGTIGDVSKFTSFVKKEGLKNIRVEGFQPHEKMPQYLAMADVLVLPTSGQYHIGKYESSPLKLFEYMASGKPIVASRLPAVCDIVDESHVHFVDPDKAQELGKAILEVLESGSGKTQAAYNRVKSQSWENRAKDIIHFIQN